MKCGYATAKKAVKVGVDEGVWRDLKERCMCEKTKIGENVEKALKTYMDVLKGEAVLMYDSDSEYERYEIVNALELDFESISGNVFLPLLGSFSKDVLEHFINLLAPYITVDKVKLVQNFEGTGDRHKPIYDDPELLAKELLTKKSYLHIDLTDHEEPIPIPRVVVIGHDFADFKDLIDEVDER